MHEPPAPRQNGSANPPASRHGSACAAEGRQDLSTTEARLRLGPRAAKSHGVVRPSRVLRRGFVATTEKEIDQYEQYPAAIDHRSRQIGRTYPVVPQKRCDMIDAKTERQDDKTR